MGNTTQRKKNMHAKHGLVGLLVGICLTASAFAGPSVNVSIDGQVAPGVYGRINIGNGPAPVLVYPQPVVIYQPVRPVQASPIYLSVPPGHSKNWGQHCRRYNACGQQVYFVRTAEYEPGYHEHQGRKDKRDKRDHHGERRGHGHGHEHEHGKGRGHD
jgi:hypothetical protein